MDPTEDAAVQDFLEILEEHRKNCERQGKYVEAEIAKNRLDELKLHEENRRRVRDCRNMLLQSLMNLCHRKLCVAGKLRSAWVWRKRTCWNSSNST